MKTNSHRVDPSCQWVSNDCNCEIMARNVTFRCRGRTVKTLESRPIQMVLCLLMIFDAAVVIAEILLDLHAMRSQYISVFRPFCWNGTL